ncbi:hypothetical protein V8C86DRAFT_2747047, partial [Haematococcus lacustris]
VELRRTVRFFFEGAVMGNAGTATDGARGGRRQGAPMMTARCTRGSAADQPQTRAPDAVLLTQRVKSPAISTTLGLTMPSRSSLGVVALALPLALALLFASSQASADGTARRLLGGLKAQAGPPGCVEPAPPAPEPEPKAPFKDMIEKAKALHQPLPPREPAAPTPLQDVLEKKAALHEPLPPPPCTPVPAPPVSHERGAMVDVEQRQSRRA